MNDDVDTKGTGRDGSQNTLRDFAGGPTLDIDGDGNISPWESNLCRLCLIGALAIAFGDKAINLI